MPEPLTASSRLLPYLPAIFQEQPFLGNFLLAFEEILLGRTAGAPWTPALEPATRGLEEIIGGLALYFDPNTAPLEFLPWLASWVAFSFQPGLTEPQQRRFLQQIVTLYPMRGTRQNLENLLRLFVLGDPVVDEAPESEARLGLNSTLGSTAGKRMYLDGPPPHFFEVTVHLEKLIAEVAVQQEATVRALIELEKPAHTHYQLNIIAPITSLGVSRLDKDTLLGVPQSP